MTKSLLPCNQVMTIGLQVTYLYPARPASCHTHIYPECFKMRADSAKHCHKPLLQVA